MTATKHVVKVAHVIQCYWPNAKSWRDESAPLDLPAEQEHIEIYRKTRPGRQFRLVRYTTTMEVVQEEPQP